MVPPPTPTKEARGNVLEAAVGKARLVALCSGWDGDGAWENNSSSAIAVGDAKTRDPGVVCEVDMFRT